MASACRSASKRAIDLPRVHPRLDDLQRDGPLDRLGLLGHEHHAHAAFADLLQQLVRADDRAGALGYRPIELGVQARRWHLEKVSQGRLMAKELFDLGTK